MQNPTRPHDGVSSTEKAIGYVPPRLQPAQQLLRVLQVWVARGDTPQGSVLQISVLQCNTVPVTMLLLCILKASNAVPNQDLLYLAPTTQQ